jgi:hypothetical protein
MYRYIIGRYVIERYIIGRYIIGRYILGRYIIGRYIAERSSGGDIGGMDVIPHGGSRHVGCDCWVCSPRFLLEQEAHGVFH